MRFVLLLTMVGTAASAQVKLAAPGFTAVKVEDSVAKFYSQYFAQKLAEQDGIKVTTRAEMEALIGLERQRELLGCSDAQSSCVAELAGALGVDGLITGTLAKLGSAYTVSIKIVSASNAETLALASGRVEDDDALHKFLDDVAEDLADQLREKRPREAETAATIASTGSTKRNWPAIGAVAGGAALLGAGTYFYAQAKNAEWRLRGNGERIPESELSSFVLNAQSNQTLGFVLGGAGIVALGAGAALFAVGGEQKVALLPTTDGAAIVFTGRLP